MPGPDESVETSTPTEGFSTQSATAERPAVGADDVTLDGAGAAVLPSSRIERYRIGETIGRGGMGEVLEAYDERVGRAVALKRMREDKTASARFLREARIQARLEHPAIVPVHDVGFDGDGRPYFTMKRVSGTTLLDLLRDPEVPQQRLLRVFVDVCHALELAHRRGVVHRDVKPANIMAGDFGEVYLLDWGIARVFEGSDVVGPAVADEQTQTNIALGTPRYMAPEQARGEIVGPAADVYALGAVLFELLTHQQLRPTTSLDTDAIERPLVSPALRAPARAIPPELDAACTSALAPDPVVRPSARELGRAIERYLDGDRDVERRRALARESLVAARTAVDSGDPARRADAMQAAARALALDPESRDAAALVSSLMLTPPDVQPAGLQAVLAATDEELVVRQRRIAVVATGAYFLFLPVVLWMGLKNVPTVVAIYAVVSITWVAARRAVRRRTTSMMFAMLSHGLLIAMLSRIVGPFVLIPALAGMVSTALTASPPLTERKWLVIGTMVATMLVPLALERLGVLASTWSVAHGELAITSPTVGLGGASAATFLIGSNVAVIVLTGLIACSLAASRREAIRRAESQAWHLAQLLPRARSHAE